MEGGALNMVDYIGDSLVEFDTAKALEAAGYSEECTHACLYSDGGEHSEPYEYGGVKTRGVKLNKFKTVMVPTQTAALKWLRGNGFPGVHCAYVDNGMWGVWIPAGVPDIVGHAFRVYEDCAEYTIFECAKHKLNKKSENNGCNASDEA